VELEHGDGEAHAATRDEGLTKVGQVEKRIVMGETTVVGQSSGSCKDKRGLTACVDVKTMDMCAQPAPIESEVTVATPLPATEEPDTSKPPPVSLTRTESLKWTAQW
jgi:hypothetical protein